MNTTAAAAIQAPTLEIRFGQVSLPQVRIRTTDPGAILDELTGRVASAPRFFERTAVCLDLSALDKEPDVGEVRAVLGAITRAGMVHGGPRAWHGHRRCARAVARPAGADLFRAPQPQGAAGAAAGGPGAAGSSPSQHSMNHSPVRSGQRVYAWHRDLVVTATVGAGAEVMRRRLRPHLRRRCAGGRWPARGGEATARVFCHEFYAELVAVAGVFRVFETIPEELKGHPVQAWLAGDEL